MAAAWIASAGILIVGLGYGPETGIKVGGKGRGDRQTPKEGQSRS